MKRFIKMGLILCALMLFAVVAQNPAQPTPELKEAQELLDRLQFDKAKNLLQGIVAQNPNEAAAWRMLRQIYQAQNNRQEEIAALEKAVAISPDKGSVDELIEIAKSESDEAKRIKYSVIYTTLELAAADKPRLRTVLEDLLSYYEQTQNADEYYKTLNKLLEIAPKSEVYQFKKGVIAFKKQDFYAAFEAFSAVLAISPAYQGLSAYLGDAAFQISKFEVAAPQLEKAAAQASQADKVRLYSSAAKSFEAINNDAKSAECFEAVLKIEEKNSEAVNRLVAIYERLKNKGRLQALYAIQLEQAGGRDVVILAKQAGLLKETDPAKAIDAYNAILASDGNSAPAISGLLDIYSAQKNKAKEIEFLGKLMQIDPTPEGNRKLAYMLLSSGDTAKAVSALADYLIVKSDAWTDMFTLANLYFKAGQFDKTVSVTAEIMADKNKKPVDAGEVALLRAKALIAKKESARAAEDLAAAVAANPKLAEAWHLLAKYKMDALEWAPAKEAFLKAKALGVKGDDLTLGLAVSAYESADYVTALPNLEAASKNAPSDNTLNTKLAATLLALGKLDAVSQVFKRMGAVEVEKSFSGSVTAAEAQLKAGESQSARRMLVQALTTDSKNPKILRMLADIETASKDYTSAVDRLGSLLVITDDNNIRREIADLYLALKEPKQASAAYEVYLKKNPKDKKVLDTLFNIYESANEPEKAYPVLTVLTEIDPKSPVYLFKKGRIEFLRKEYQKASITFSEVAKVAPKQEKLNRNLGLSNYYSQKYAEAELPLAEAYKEDTADLALAKQLAEVYEKNSKNAAAAPLYEKMLVADGSDKVTLEKLIAVYENAKNNSRLEALYAKRMELSVQDAATLTKLSAVQLALKAPDRAILTFETLLRVDPSNAAALLAVADLYEDKKDSKKAAEKLEKLVELKPDAALNLRLANMYIASADSAKAVPALERYTLLKKDAAGEMLLLGQCYLVLKEYGKAEVVLKKVVDLKGASGAGISAVYLALATALEGLGKTAEAVAALEQSLKSDSRNYAAQYKVGTYHLKNKNFSAAVTALLVSKNDKALEDGSVRGLAECYYALSDLKNALPYLEQLNKKEAGNAVVLERLAEAYLAAGNNQAAVKVLAELNGKGGIAKFDSNVGAAYAFLSAKDDKNAEPILVKYIASNGKDEKALRALADLYVRTTQNKKAAAVLTQLNNVKPAASLQKEIGDLLIKEDPDASASAYEQFVKSGQKDKATLEALRQIYEAKGNIAALYPVLAALITVDSRNVAYLSRKGELDYEAKRYAEAAAAYAQVKAVNPSDDRADFVLGESYYALKQPAKAEAPLSAAVSKRTQDTELQYHYAEVLSQNRKTAPAAAAYEKVLLVKKDDVSIMDKLIVLYEGLKRNDRLIELYAKRQRTGGTEGGAFTLKLAAVYMAEKKIDEAAAAYEQILASDNGNIAALTALVDIYEGKKDSKKSAEKLEKLVDIKPDAAMNLRLANIYLAAGDSTAAVPPLERYTILKKDAVEQLVTLGHCYLSRKEYSKAEVVLKKVVDSKTAPAAVLRKAYLSYAFALEGLGKTAEAVAAYEQALKSDPKDFAAQFKVGQFHLRNKDYVKAIQALLVSKSDKAYEEGSIRGLAESYYAQSDLKSALPYLEALNVKDPGKTENLERLAAAYLATGNSALAVKTLSELKGKGGTARFDSDLGAASAYVASKDDKSAEPILVRYVASNGKDEKALRTLADLYVRGGQNKKAAATLAQLNGVKAAPALQKEMGDLLMKEDPDAAA
ncbi:MAG: tetratricopeptide repeat protein, partial [Fibrobacteres bacterium]|nr:tetratricopeptide repeat protein [Fibrobacterota bacterium]